MADIIHQQDEAHGAEMLRMSDSPTHDERRGHTLLVIGSLLLIDTILVALFIPVDRRAGGSGVTIVFIVLAVFALGFMLAGTVIKKRRQQVILTGHR